MVTDACLRSGSNHCKGSHYPENCQILKYFLTKGIVISPHRAPRTSKDTCAFTPFNKCIHVHLIKLYSHSSIASFPCPMFTVRSIVCYIATLCRYLIFYVLNYSPQHTLSCPHTRAVCALEPCKQMGR